MRHRAPRSTLALLRLSDPTRRGTGAAVALVVVAALTGVGVAITSDDADPSAANVPLNTELGTPEATTTPRIDEPPAAASRSGERTKKPSPRAEAPRTTSPTEVPSTAEPTPSASTSVPDPPSPTPTNSQRPSPSTSPVDDTAPNTTASTSAVDDDSWTISIGADEPATYECSLDSGAYQGCAATTTFSNLEHGRHSVSVRATDEAGNTDSTPAELSTTVNPAR